MPERSKPKQPLLTFIDSLPERKAKLFAEVKPDWEAAGTYQMSGAAYHYANSIVEILVELCSYYTWELFEDQSPEEYFADFIRYRIKWHYAIGEPDGPGTHGTMMISLVAFDVADDVDELVEEMVFALDFYENNQGFDFASWRRSWRDAR